MRDSPSNLFSPPQQQPSSSLPSSPSPPSSSTSSPLSQQGQPGETLQRNSRRRVKDQMGEGYYMNMDESNGNESPKKRARTGSLSDCEMDSDNTQKEPIQATMTGAEIDGEGDVDAMNVVISDTSSGSMDGDFVPSTPPTKEEQLNNLKLSFIARLAISSSVYLIPTKWYETFSAWAQGTAQEPGPVDPHPTLCDTYGVLREDAIEGRDWQATNEEGWSLIKRCHGADSEVARKVIPESPTSQSGIIELRPPEIVLTKIVTPLFISAREFDFSATVSSATSIVVSKADTLESLESEIRGRLNLLPTGLIRCYKFPVNRTDSILSKLTTKKIAPLIPDRENTLDFSLKSRTIGQIGIVEPYLGIAVEWKHIGGTFPMDQDLPSTDQSSTQESSYSIFSNGGRTLGGIPNSIIALSHHRPSTENHTFDSDDENAPLGKINGKPVSGPVLPGSYPRTTPINSYLRSSSSGDRFGERYKSSFNTRFTESPPKEERVRGTTGLNNLGNTCYMNSALQCLVHCKEFTEYFLSHVYKSELNETNPLGMNGLLAKSYAYLIFALFNPTYQKPSLPPSEFKKTIGRFAPNFSGYGQQDSQEFLAFLLDGLHEDLNRVKKKPYVVRDELVGVLPSEEQLKKLGDSSWGGHRLRNDSVVVDLWQGMYKSTVVCPVCDVVSVTFDPFMDLSVPLPIKQTWKHPSVHFIPHAGKLVKMMVELPRNAYIRDLKKIVGERMNVDPSTLLSAEIFSKKFFKHHSDNMLLTDAVADGGKDDVTIYELPELNSPDSVVLPVISGFWNTRSPYYPYTTRFEEFGLPLYVALTKDEQHDFDKIYEKIRRKYSQFSSAEELHISPTAEKVADDAMGEISSTRQDINPNMVTIRVQPYSKNSFYFNQSTEVEMPTNVERPNGLADLREYLQPPVSRMQSLAPSAMESVHQEPSTPPESDHGNISEDTIYLNHNDAYADQPQESDVDITLTDAIDESLDDSNDLRFSDSDVVQIEEASDPSMVDSDEENITPSQIGRAHAPSPTVPDGLPSYSQLFPSSNDELTSDAHELKFGDALLCEWSDGAYQHVFNNLSYQVYWDTYETWVDPSPPPVANGPKKKHIDLEDCLDEFAREEELGQDDLWYCPRCKEHRQAKKTLQLWRVPDIFAVHLKRFSANRGFRDKLDNFVDFPLRDLDLTERVGDKMWIEHERGGEKLIYDLFAVDNHYGGLGGGHYTAYAQNFVDGKWYYFDDSSVRPARPEDAVTSAAYLLFYRRRSEMPLGGNTSKLIAENAGKNMSEDSDSTTTSPKNDHSGSSSPVPALGSTIRSALNSGFANSSSLESLYAPLAKRDPVQWSGGWSNRALGSTYRLDENPIRRTEATESSSSGVESQNITPDGADADVESTNDGDNEIEVVEHIPMDVSETSDEVQVIKLDPMDGDRTA